jgi:NitT/TauT family transport system substrate-binding protein
VSKAKGFWKEEGLDVEINHVTDIGSVRSILSGKGDIAYTPLTSMANVRQTTGKEVKNIFTYQQTSPMSVIAKAEAGIEEAADLKGKSISDFAGSATQLLWPVFLERNGLAKDDVQVKLVDPASRQKLVITDQVDAELGFWPNNAPDLRLACKCDISEIRFDDRGVRHLGNGYAVMGELMEKDPEMLKAFVRGVVKGLQFTIDNPQEATDIVIAEVGDQLAGPKEGARDQVESVGQQAHSRNTTGKALGWIAEEDWKETIDVMVAAGAMKPVDDPASYFTNEFNPSPDGTPSDGN